MRTYDVFLYDDIGNAYERKNQYIKELIALEETQDRTKIRLFKQHKKQHPYQLALKVFKEEEKQFKKDLKDKKRTYGTNQDKALSRKVNALKRQRFVAEEKYDFYKAYEELSYDAALIARENKIIKNQLGGIIEHLECALEQRQSLKQEKKLITSEQTKEETKAYRAYKKQQNKQLKEQIKNIKVKQKEGSISKKALENSKKELVAKYKSQCQLKQYEITKKGIGEALRSNAYECNHVTRQKLIVLQDDCANIRRRTPYETTKRYGLHAYIGALIPGIGQLLNKQWMKAIGFILATLFIYFIAIPYALGYGNYQGQGIEGLFTLAEGAPRVHRSLIYMIEGIVALFLVVFAVVLLLLSFRDARKVEKDSIRGIRPKNWFETKKTILEDGFPYLVSLPSLVVIVFIVIVPITTAILLSFTNMDPKNQSKFSWIGLQNYTAIAKGQGMAGSVFWNILGWTLIWTLTATTLAIAIGFFLALLANNERIKGKTFFRTIFLLPWAVPAFITIMFFSIMLSRDGVLTQLIHQLTGVNLDIKNHTVSARITLIMLQGWLGSAYVFLLSTGVLQSIPEDLYEAAQIDGASAWQKLRRITLPIVLFQTAPLLVGQYTFNFNNFSIIYLFNGGGPFNPKQYGNLAGSTDLLISYIYKLTMDNQQQAIGAAITIFISLGLMVFAFIGFKNSKAFKEERL